MSEFRQRMLRMRGARAYRLARAITGDDRGATRAVHRAIASCDETADELDFLTAVRGTALESAAGSSDYADLLAEVPTEDKHTLLCALLGTRACREPGFEDSFATALERLRSSHNTPFELREEDIP